MISRAVLKRRSLLKQLGASAFLAIPVFRSVIAEAQATAPKRLVLFHFPSGVSTKQLGMEETVKNSTWDYDYVLQGLKEIQSDVIVFQNMTHPTGDIVSSFNELEGHGGGMRTMFTGSTDHASTEIVPVSQAYGKTSSIDQLVANALQPTTQFGSLQLGVITTANGTAEGRRCIFNNGTHLEPVEDPQAVFSRLFPSGAAAPAPSSTMAPDPNATAELLAVYQQGKSRLDQLKAELEAVRSIVSTEERAKFDLHLTSLRELENALPRVGGSGGISQGVTCQAPNIGGIQGTQKNAPEYYSVDFIQQLGPVMQELAYQAINCDLSRIVSFQWLSTGDNSIFPFLGIKDTHHHLEHGWGGGAGIKGDYDKIQTWLMDQISMFIKRLRMTPESNGNMLDNSVVLVASEMWGGHGHQEYIGLVAGKGGGAIRPGRVLDAGGRSNNDLLVTIANAMGVNVNSVGDPMYCAGPIDLS
ncbi:MAG: DUF1552 domain-containing protein [Polyangiaceae bacterium]|nr:DUF1552 domain-containing protein [Polyangiaceae bacterium]